MLKTELLITTLKKLNAITEMLKTSIEELETLLKTMRKWD